jgi:hypothetical protein
MRVRSLLLSLLGVVAFIGVFVVIGFMASPSQALRADVGIEGPDLVIRNQDSRTWTDLSMRLNHGYAYRHEALRAGETARIALTQFASSDGTRFNQSRTKPLTIYVKAEVTSAGDTADGGWSFR